MLYMLFFKRVRKSVSINYFSKECPLNTWMIWKIASLTLRYEKFLLDFYKLISYVYISNIFDKFEKQCRSNIFPHKIVRCNIDFYGKLQN